MFDENLCCDAFPILDRFRHVEAFRHLADEARQIHDWWHCCNAQVC